MNSTKLGDCWKMGSWNTKENPSNLQRDLKLSTGLPFAFCFSCLKQSVSHWQLCKNSLRMRKTFPVLASRSQGCFGNVTGKLLVQGKGPITLSRITHPTLFASHICQVPCDATKRITVAEDLSQSLMVWWRIYTQIWSFKCLQLLSCL